MIMFVLFFIVVIVSFCESILYEFTLKVKWEFIFYNCFCFNLIANMLGLIVIILDNLLVIRFLNQMPPYPIFLLEKLVCIKALLIFALTTTSIKAIFNILACSELKEKKKRIIINNTFWSNALNCFAIGIIFFYNLY